MEVSKAMENKKKYGSKYFAKVVRILDPTTIIIDAGKSDIRVGDLVQVYEYLGELLDPDGNSLGSFEFIKTELEVVRVEPLYSICQTPKQTKSVVISPLLDTSYRPKFNVRPDDINPLQAKDPAVKVGDPVKRA